MRLSGRKVAGLEIILKMSFPSGVPLAVSSEISPCCFLSNGFILSAVQTHGGFFYVQDERIVLYCRW